MGGSWTIELRDRDHRAAGDPPHGRVEDLFAAGRILNGAAPYAILASPLAGPVVPQGQRKLLELAGLSRGNAASS
jgi:hypothetical protein